MPLHREALAGLIVSCLSAGSPAAAQPLTEAEAIRLYLDESPRARLGSLRAEADGARIRAEAQVRNPEISYQIEDAGSARDEFLVFEQEIPVSGRRGLLRGTAESASSRALLDAAHDLARSVHALRLAFHEMAYRDRALLILKGGDADMERTVAILRAREREGEGSGYDVLRAEQEHRALGARSAEAGAEREAALSRLRSFFPERIGAAITEVESGREPDEEISTAGEAVAFALSHRSDLRALDAEVERRDLEARAARRLRIPEPILAAGLKRVETLGDAELGYVASVAVPLPLFARGRLEETRARADRATVEAERELLRREIEAEVLSAHARARASRDVAARLGSDLAGRADELERIARLAYEEGEHGILERLDAHRTTLEMRLQSAQIRHQAIRAGIELDRAMGREVTP